MYLTFPLVSVLKHPVTVFTPIVFVVNAQSVLYDFDTVIVLVFVSIFPASSFAVYVIVYVPGTALNVPLVVTVGVP